MSAIIGKFFGNTGKSITTIFILLSVLLTAWLSYKIVTSIIDSTNRTAAENNIAVAVKAKEDLKHATEQLNQAAEEMKAIQDKIKADEALRDKNKEITESNKKELERVINKIETINNIEVIYEETPIDKVKSKIIIDSIWEIYEGANNEPKKN